MLLNCAKAAVFFTIHAIRMHGIPDAGTNFLTKPFAVVPSDRMGGAMKISRKTFDEAQVDTGVGGAEARKLIREALDNGTPLIVTAPNGSEEKVGRDDRGKFTFTPLAKGIEQQ